MKSRASSYVLMLIDSSRDDLKASHISESSGSYTILLMIYLSLMQPKARIRIATGMGSLIWGIVASIVWEEGLLTVVPFYLVFRDTLNC